jgi:lipid kinase YegS
MHMTPPRWCLILNGKSAGDAAVREAVDAMRGRGVALDVRVTWEAGDADRCLAEAIERGVGSVIAGGGDGTLSAVAAALAHRDEAADALPALGLLPLGTANDFASAAGIPTQALAALECIHDRPARPIDLLRLRANGATHWAANLASGGFGTQVTVETRDGLKKLLGGLAYLVTGMARLGRIEPIAARMRGPGFEWRGGFIALGIGNGRQAGGGQALCPEALIDDGLFDLTIVPELSGEIGSTLATLLKEGRHGALDQAAVRTRLPWLEIEADAPLVLNLDGEPVESTRFRIECVPGRVRMHLPSDSPLMASTTLA